MTQKTARHLFPLFQSPIDLAHAYWQNLVIPGDCVIDATCGNGHDALVLAKLVSNEDVNGSLIAIDKQPSALTATQQRLASHLSAQQLTHMHFISGCHSAFPADLTEGSVKLIVYNLGYLPGGDKTLTTCRDTTLQSLAAALPLLCAGGALSITCYPGHAEGKIEEERVLEFAATLDNHAWSCCLHRWVNRRTAPTLLLIQRSTPPDSKQSDGPHQP